MAAIQLQEPMFFGAEPMFLDLTFPANQERYTPAYTSSHLYAQMHPVIVAFLNKLLKERKAVKAQESLNITANHILHLVYDFDPELTVSKFKKQNETVSRAIRQQQNKLRRIHSPQSTLTQHLGSAYLHHMAELEKDIALPRKANKPNPYFIRQIYALLYRFLQMETHTREIAQILTMLDVDCSEQTIEKNLSPSTRKSIHAKIDHEIRQEKERLSRMALLAAQTATAATPQTELADTEKLLQIKILLQSIQSPDCKDVAAETLAALLESMDVYGVLLPE